MSEGKGGAPYKGNKQKKGPKLQADEYIVPGYREGHIFHPDRIQKKNTSAGATPAATTNSSMAGMPAVNPNGPVTTGHATMQYKGAPVLPGPQVQHALMTPGAGASYAQGGMVHSCPTCKGAAHYANGGWIGAAIKHPGREKRAAAKAGESTHAYMEQHKGAPGSAGSAARLGLKLEGYQGGGPVEGPGTGTSDSVHAQLSNGEYVIPEHVVSYLGAKFFDDLVDKAEAEMGVAQTPDAQQQKGFSDMVGEAPGEG